MTLRLNASAKIALPDKTLFPSHLLTTLAFSHLSIATILMAPFASLPNELIRDILKLVQPEDLENVAQSSRNVFQLAAPFLDEHRALIRQYRTLSNPTGPGCIANFLSTVIASPRIGSYVRKVELGQLMVSQARQDRAKVYTKEEVDIFTTAALDSECLEIPSGEEIVDEREFWSNTIQDGNEEILLAILLPLLPNLANFTVTAGIYDSRRVWYDSAIEKAASATKPTLCKLANIRLNPDRDYGSHLYELQRFSTLPSVRVLTAPKTYCVEFSHKISPDANSNVTHLKLWESCIDSKELYEFLRGFPKLQSFTLLFQEFLDDFYASFEYDGFLIRSSLLAHCKATLQSLTLLAPGRRDTSFMGSLRGFETLREVYIEWSHLVSTVPYSGGPRLNEHLPASLIRLKIHDSEGREYSEYEEVIESAQYAKEHRLPKLESLTFGGIEVGWTVETIGGDLEKTCKNMGITLVFSPYAPGIED